MKRMDQLMAISASLQDQEVAKIADWVREQDIELLAIWFDKIKSRDAGQMRSLNDSEIEMVRALAMVGMFVVMERLTALEGESGC